MFVCVLSFQRSHLFLRGCSCTCMCDVSYIAVNPSFVADCMNGFVSLWSSRTMSTALPVRCCEFGCPPFSLFRAGVLIQLVTLPLCL